MSTQTNTKQVQWQDLKVRSEVDVVLEIAKKERWKDCEIFGYGDMITQPQESNGWNLIPADMYKYSIPSEGIARLHQIINAGVRIQGVIVADDERREETPRKPARPKISLPSFKVIVSPVISFLSSAIAFLSSTASFLGKVFLGIICIAGILALVSSIVLALVHLGPLAIILGLVVAIGVSVVRGVEFDPKLVILVDDGEGGTTWISLLTWYE